MHTLSRNPIQNFYLCFKCWEVVILKNSVNWLFVTARSIKNFFNTSLLFGLSTKTKNHLESDPSVEKNSSFPAIWSWKHNYLNTSSHSHFYWSFQLFYCPPFNKLNIYFYIRSYCICTIGFYCNQMTHRLWVLSKICREVPLLDPTMIPMKFERNPSLMKNAFSAFNLYFHFQMSVIWKAIPEVDLFRLVFAGVRP